MPTNVRLLPQIGLRKDDIVTMSQIIRASNLRMRFGEYESQMQIALTSLPEGSWNGVTAYDTLASQTRQFVKDNSFFSVTNASGYSFDDADATEVNRRFLSDDPTATTLGDLQASSKTLDGDPVGGAQVVPPDSGTLKISQMRANQQVSTSQELISSSNLGHDGLIEERLKQNRCIELIWSYWMEQAMLVQGINAITHRYQNRRPIGPDPLSRCDISYLRPITNLLWGYIQREPERLSLARRAHEYDHFYGLRLQGGALSPIQPADSRSEFLASFHALLNLASRFFVVSMNTTMQADAYPALHAIKELSLILEAGMQNQFWELPMAAREEMLIQQFFLHRSEIKDFLNSRPNMTYPEPWMPQLDALRSMMSWNDGSIRSYYDLATYGEQILVSIRLWPWSTENNDQVAAAWLQAWRPEIQGYIHAYRSVTGVDLSISDPRAASSGLVLAQPTDLILRRRSALANARV